MKNDSSFGVVLLAEGQETIGAVQTQATGTLATISDWYQGEDGLLGITAMGGNRFRLLSAQQQDDGLNLGSIEILPPEPEVPMPGDYAVMADLLRAVMHDIGDLYAGVERNFDDASWVGYRFAEILPLELASKQHCLEIDDPLVRLEFLRPFLRYFCPLKDPGWLAFATRALQHTRSRQRLRVTGSYPQITPAFIPL